MRHLWGEPDRPDHHHTFRRCECGALKVSRHEGDRHWIEYRMGGVATATAPACTRKRTQEERQ